MLSLLQRIEMGKDRSRQIMPSCGCSTGHDDKKLLGYLNFTDIDWLVLISGTLRFTRGIETSPMNVIYQPLLSTQLTPLAQDILRRIPSAHFMNCLCFALQECCLFDMLVHLIMFVKEPMRDIEAVEGMQTHIAILNETIIGYTNTV